MSELLEQLPSHELTYWVEFFNLEPWGFEVENWRMGQIASTIVNCTPRGRGAKVFKPTDFYQTEQHVDPLTAEQREFLKRKKRGNRRHRND